MWPCRNRKKYVKTRVWETSEIEEKGFPEEKLDFWSKKNDLGIAFSGGGTRSATATLGQLRGLRKIGLLDKARYVSAVSGGAWCATPFVFLPKRFSEDTFLGDAKPPGEITLQSLKDVPEQSMAYVISDTFIPFKFFESALSLAGDETYSRTVGKLFLKPFGLHESHKFFTFNRQTLDDALNINSQEEDKKYYLTEKDFHVAGEDRPFLIVGALVLTKPPDDRTSMEFTPYYTGTRKYLKHSTPIGGGYINTFAYDSESPDKSKDSPVRVKLGASRYVLALSDMMGASSAAPQKYLYKFPLLGFPEFNHWPVRKVGGSFHKHEELLHIDGGISENLAIMPLLARKVKNIIVFVNSDVRFRFEKERPEERIDISVASLFVRVKEDDDSEPSSLNIVFEDGGNKFEELLNAFKDRQSAAGPLVFCGEYAVKDNGNYEVRRYNGVKICWVYNERVPSWERKLSNEIKEMIYEDVQGETLTGDFENFPNYKTFLENIEEIKIIDLSREQVNLLAHLSCWNITENEDEIKRFFGF